MDIAMIGLGRMGGNMARRLARGGHRVVACDPNDAARRALDGEPGVETVGSVTDAVAALTAPRMVWVMLPAGGVTDGVVAQLRDLLAPGDVVVDGGNAFYKDSQQRSVLLAERDLHFVDAGVSGGVWGITEGYGLMVGGSDADVERLSPVLRTLAPTPDSGWVHAGPVGAGHFTKMVHNGIEYGLMQAYAEGFALLDARNDLVADVGAVAEAWRDGTVIRSWLLDLAAGVLTKDPAMDDVAAVVADSGEGRWTVHEGVDLGVPLPVITAALYDRYASQGHADYGDKLLAKLRQSFGGHPVTPPGD
ncbi:MAG: decarboxylating 6-phosphogluconate dehydrogenase [Actinomycetes bacterium]